MICPDGAMPCAGRALHLFFAKKRWAKRRLSAHSAGRACAARARRHMVTSGRQAGWYPTLPPGTLEFFRMRRGEIHSGIVL